MELVNIKFFILPEYDNVCFNSAFTMKGNGDNQVARMLLQALLVSLEKNGGVII